VKTVTRTLLAVVLLAAFTAPLCAQGGSPSNQSQTPRQEQQTEFVPLDQLPPQEQLPAPRLLIAAYVFVLAALFFYVLSVSRRLGAVHREVQRLEADLRKSGRP
jgi:CcmD family protein